MSRHLIIPFFIPFKGCPVVCVYCDQRAMTGAGAMPGPLEIRQRIETYLGTWKGGGRKEAAFYGGTFTAMSRCDQEACLGPVQAYLKEGLLHGIRVSTRPDCVDKGTAGFLRARGVAAVELGAQSMDDSVLVLSRRGHGAADTVRAAGVLKGAGMKVGLQLMPGLPGDDGEKALKSAREAAALGPDFVRIYPTVVMRGTALEKMYEGGEYRPWGMEEMIEVCAAMARVFEGAGIRIIRMGLQSTGALSRSIVAGPYHPAFRDLVKRRLAAGTPELGL